MVLQRLVGTEPTATEQALITAGASALHRPADNPWRWHEGQYVRDYTNFYRQAGAAIQASCTATRGRLSLAWLPLVSLEPQLSPVIDQYGGRLSVRDVRRLGTGTLIGDLVSWTWQGPFTLAFKSKQQQYPMPNDTAKTFRHLCDTLVANFPAMLGRPDDDCTLHTYNIPSNADPALRHTFGGVQVALRPGSQYKDVTTHPMIQVDGSSTRPVFEHYPRLSRIVQLWAGNAPWTPERRRIKRALTAVERSTGKDTLKKRDQLWGDKDAVIGEAIVKPQWRHMGTSPGLSIQDAELWQKLRLSRLRLWPNATSPTGCQSQTCTHNGDVTTFHVMWECTEAQRIWQTALKTWKVLDATPQTHRAAIFGWSPPASTRDWRPVLQATASPTVSTAEERLAYWLRVAWRQLVLCCVRQIWRTAVARHLNQEMQPPEVTVYSLLQQWRTKLAGTVDAIARSNKTTSEIDRSIQLQLCATFAADSNSDSVHRCTTSEQYLLFFDGGSRGNPGPGGSGSVIVQVQQAPAPPVIVWAAAMSLSQRTTTNNQAEYFGLTTGLQAAADHQWHPLAVIGDSKMIINQMEARRPPRHVQLKRAYTRACHYATALMITGWHHHYRTFNKMADKAANVAMDTRCSQQIQALSKRSLAADLQDLLLTDVAHWCQTQWKDTEPSQGVHRRDDG